MRVPVLLDEPLEGLCELDRVEVGALDVLDEGELERARGRDVFDDDRDVVHPGLLRGAPASLAGDELELVARDLADDERLEQPVLRQRRGELLDRGAVEVLPGLALLRDDPLDGAQEQAGVLARARVLAGRADREQRVEPTPEGARLVLGGRRVHARLSRTSRARLR